MDKADYIRFAPTRWRGRMMAAVFSMQGFGQLAATVVALVTTIAFRKSFSSAMTISDCTGECQFAADRSWRIIIGFGCLPAIFALYYRLTIPETPRFTFDVALDADKASSDIRIFLDAEIDLEEIGTFLEESTNRRGILSEVQSQLANSDNHIPPRASWSDFYTYFTQYRNGSVLFATMASWFLLDFAFYGLALNNSIILDVLGYSASSNVYKVLLVTSLGNLILVCAGSLPGYLLSVLTMDSLGRKFIQIGGFATLTVIFCIFGFGYKHFDRAALLALYILAQLFFNFGPNATTFVVPGECFPTRYRSICHGLSAASGKLGATVVQVVTLPLITKNVVAGCKDSACSPWLAHLMQIFAAIMLCGALVSCMIPETKQQTLEVLAGETPLAGTQGSNLSRMSKESLFARFTSSLHWQGKKRSGNRQNAGDNVHRNRARMPSASNGSYASVSSTSRIVHGSRGNESGIGGHKDEADISLQDMGRLNSVLK
jgi:PHS family inorganic phosphate transporter-like MFS transporter